MHRFEAFLGYFEAIFKHKPGKLTCFDWKHS